MIEKVQFATNVPVELALQYSTGLPVEGQYGDQVLFTLEDGRKWYAPPIVGRKIEQLGLEAGEPLVVCKREEKIGNRKSIVWDVQRAGSSTAEAPRRGEERGSEPQPVARPAAAAVPAVVEPQKNQVNGNAQSDALRECLCEAIDAAAAAEQHAAARKLSIRFGGEDIRAMGLSLYINRAKEGGARWRN